MMHTQHVEARSKKGRKVVTFHGPRASEAAQKWDDERKLLASLKGRAVTELYFFLVTTHEEQLDPLTWSAL